MELRTEIIIEASPADVWAVLIDFPAYRDWNPFLTVAHGKPVKGARLEVELTPAEGKSLSYKPTITLLEAERELRWRGHFLVKGLFEGEHFFRLEPTLEGHTRFAQGENFSGVLVKIMGRVVTQMARGFVYMNQALRQRVLVLRVHRVDG